MEAAHERISSLEEQVARLELMIEGFKKQMYGGGKTERQEMLQLQLQLNELESAKAALEANEKISYERVKPKKRCLPAERFERLPVRERLTIDPEEVDKNREGYERIGEEVSFEVEITPPKLFKREIIRPKYRLKADRNKAPVMARAPKRVFEGSYDASENGCVHPLGSQSRTIRCRGTIGWV